ncbi:hypothetical protein [Rubrimonas cliftonensis]|uniref:Uncharacterized protein n=1 Tax=Rubrimonas cliftonensis TaxID=89524 RepID=A0A1H4EHH3_9RHOB|nr:hypothetical protein [Rubrimonas cliftonensis]SEA84386.1 hypothetical protein SAMN05444370_1145 [Rubrimonas cliftonensis]
MRPLAYRGVKLVLAAVASAALFGCARPPLDDLAKEYTETLDEIGYVAVFPPREDIRIGDIFLRAGERDRLDDPEASVRIHIGTIEELSCRARVLAASRLAYAPTTGDGKMISLAQPDLPQSRSSTLPAVAFPQVVSAGAGAAAAGGGAFAGLVSASGAGAERVAMSFGAVRHASSAAWAFDGQPMPAYQAPTGAKSVQDQLAECAALPALRSRGRSAGLRAYHSTVETFCPHLGALNVTAAAHRRACSDPGNKCDFIVVTDLYLARSIGYGYADAASGSFSFARGQAANLAANATAPELAGSPGAPVAAGVATAAAAIAAPGAAAEISTARSFAYAEPFPRPVAIALNAIYIDADQACEQEQRRTTAPGTGQEDPSP